MSEQQNFLYFLHLERKLKHSSWKRNEAFEQNHTHKKVDFLKIYWGARTRSGYLNGFSEPWNKTTTTQILWYIESSCFQNKNHPLYQRFYLTWRITFIGIIWRLYWFSLLLYIDILIQYMSWTYNPHQCHNRLNVKWLSLELGTRWLYSWFRIIFMKNVK